MNDSPSIYYLDDDINWFPNPEQALKEPNGLLAVGGDLDHNRVYNGYRKGIFPWYSEDEPLMWWSPDPRAIIMPDEIKLNKSLKKFLRKCSYSVSINTDFVNVMKHCAKPRPNSEGTWIMPEMIEAYSRLHQEGKAHSIEIWQIDSEGKNLVGGLYGIIVGQCFCGESMFSLSPNASKLALLCLGQLMSENDCFIDCQLPNPYLMSMGAKLVSRSVYLSLLQKCEQKSLPKGRFSPKFIEWKSKFNL